MSKHKIKIEFEEEAVSLEELLKCKTCKKPLRKTSEYTYQFDCDHVSKDVIVSVG